MIAASDTVSRPPLRRYGPPKSAPHPCSLCGRECPGRRSQCMTCRVRIKRLRFKIAAVMMLGNRCKQCGWQASSPAEFGGYVFHHSGDDKAFQIGGATHRPWREVKAEVTKCELWCARCHDIHHSAYHHPRLLEMVIGYEGGEADLISALALIGVSALPNARMR